MPVLDLNLTVRDIQGLADAEAVAGFFALLGYNTNDRVVQSAENLGITAETTARPIRRIELIADQEGLLQVYLFELKSVTVSHTRNLVKAFRNRSGNYLLVLTSDYERIDFVLLEKFLPSSRPETFPLGIRQVGVRPRILTVDRRKPGKVELRVLRRFTYTESDPLAQYEKLLSALTVAEWSEEHFNNRALFSDYYLKERLPERSEWREETKSPYLFFRDYFLQAGSKYANKNEQVLRRELFEPVFQRLGFAWKAGKEPTSDSYDQPDYYLTNPDHGNTLAVALTYPWGRSLDGKDDQRDKDTPEENPNALVVSLLERSEAPWAIVTNGKVWRLYSAKTHSRATNYYEIDLEEIVAASGPQAESLGDAFRYYWLLFRAPAFIPHDLQREGQTVKLSFLDLLLAESEDYARELRERLKERVFTQIFPHLAAGFIHFIREKEGREAELSQERLDRIFQGALTLLYRLLFLFFAESLDLLPVKEIRGYYQAGLSKIKQEIAGLAGNIGDEAPGLIKKHYPDHTYDLYDRLTRLFRVVDQGDPGLNVPVYNGGLFLSQPQPADLTGEAVNARFLNEHRVPDRPLALALDLLARDLDPKRHDLVFVDYKSLGVRQLGSIYEGLLEFKLRLADRKLGVVSRKGREVYQPYSELNDREKARAEKNGKVVRQGGVYLENDKRERKATGSYYTPDHIVKYIVEHAVGPVLQEKFEALRPKLRAAEKRHKAFLDRQSALKKAGLKPEPDSKGDLIGRELVDELFDLKVLDPAMGSGHFLVQTVDFVTDKVLDFLNAFPWNPIRAYLEETRRTILEEMEDQGVSIDPKRLTDVNLLKRHVLKRCIYGVDLNPMAVELAKVSLWLDCFTLGAPLSFLDHHLRCGNSLIGVTVEEARIALEEKKGDQLGLFGSRFAGLLLATDLMRQVGELSDVTSAQVRKSREEYAKAVRALSPFKRILDVYTSQWFGNGGPNKKTEPPAVKFLKAIEPETEAFINARGRDELEKALQNLDPEDRLLAETALKAAEDKRFFHWELEFPEVFYRARPGTTQTIERLEGAGFDAVIGNPPYVRIQGQDELLLEYVKEAFSTVIGKFDIYIPFIEQGLSLLTKGGFLGFIVPNKFFSADYGKKLTEYIFTSKILWQLLDFEHHQVFPDITTYVCLLFLRAGNPNDNPSLLMADPSLVNISNSNMELLPYSSHRLKQVNHDAHNFLTPLSKIFTAIFQGVITGADRLLIGKIEHDRVVFNGIPFRLEPGIVKPILKGKDVKRYKINYSNCGVIYPYYLDDKVTRLMDEKILQSFPETYKYLTSSKSELVSRGSISMRYESWYALWCQRRLERLVAPKILVPTMARRASFALDYNGNYFFVGGGNAGVYGLIPRDDLPVDIYYLLGVLNSRYFDSILQPISSVFRGGYFSYARRYLEKTPIRVMGFSENEYKDVKLISSLVKARLHETDIKKNEQLEKEIDSLTFKLHA